jgi:DivIVA domain-containing protein
MPLTPEDVSNKRFTPVRLREGYDMGEVDQFLDEVEAELERLLKENDDLRTKLASSHGADAVAEVTAAQKTAAPEQDAVVEDATGPDDAEDAKDVDEPAQVQDAPVATPAPVREEIKVVTPAEASSAALRLLELATRNADEVERMAKDDAERLLADARAEAERLESETKATTDRLEQEARERAQLLDSETETKRAEALGDLERQKASLDGEIENLRAFEREYRSRLKTYFTEQLEALDGHGEAGELPGPGGAQGAGLGSVPGHQASPDGPSQGNETPGGE